MWYRTRSLEPGKPTAAWTMLDNSYDMSVQLRLLIVGLSNLWKEQNSGMVQQNEYKLFCDLWNVTQLTEYFQFHVRHTTKWRDNNYECLCTRGEKNPIDVTATEALILHPLLGDREHARITESICILMPINRIKQKCFQISTKQVHWSQQFQLRRQPVPCSQCSNRKGSVANSSTCPQHDEVATWWGA